MTYNGWIVQTDEIMSGLEGRYGMRIDWYSYEVESYDWRGAYLDGQTPADAVADAVTWRMTDEERSRFAGAMATLS